MLKFTEGRYLIEFHVVLLAFIVQRINPHLEALCDVEVYKWRYLIEAHVVLLAFIVQRINHHLEALCNVEIDGREIYHRIPCCSSGLF